MTKDINTNVLVKLLAVRNNSELTPNERLILNELIFSVDNTSNIGYASYNTIRKHTRMGVNTIKALLKALQEAGVIKQLKQGNNITSQASQWKLNPEMISQYKMDGKVAVVNKEVSHEQEQSTEVLHRETKAAPAELPEQPAVDEQNAPEQDEPDTSTAIVLQFPVKEEAPVQAEEIKEQTMTTQNDRKDPLEMAAMSFSSFLTQPEVKVQEVVASDESNVIPLEVATPKVEMNSYEECEEDSPEMIAQLIAEAAKRNAEMKAPTAIANDPFGAGEVNTGVSLSLRLASAQRELEAEMERNRRSQEKEVKEARSKAAQQYIGFGDIQYAEAPF
ncbi:TPA: hypothetical protein ACPVXB_005073 [Vibrio parahaemolyticus]